MSYDFNDDDVKVLLGHGADCQIKGGDGEETALHIAARIDEARGDKCSKVTLLNRVEGAQFCADQGVLAPEENMGEKKNYFSYLLTRFIS